MKEMNTSITEEVNEVKEKYEKIEAIIIFQT